MASPQPQVLFPAVSSDESSVAQVMECSDPLAIPSSELEAGGSAESLTPASPTLTEGSDAEEPRVSGSSGRRPHYNTEEIRSLWNMGKIFRRLDTKEKCIQFAEERNLIPTNKMCRYHRKPMSLKKSSGHLGMFSCRKGNCRNNKTESRAKGTWFENVRLPLDLVFQIMYMFSHSFTYHQVHVETAREDRETVISSVTIAEWFCYCRETLIIYELAHQECHDKIGGPGKVVQINQSTFGKRKHNRGTNIEGHWVLGMIEDGSDDLRLEVCPNNEKSAEILVPLIKKHVQEGTEIHTDLWKADDCLPEHGFIHKFVSSDGTHTQRIKSHWRNLKDLYKRDQYKVQFSDWIVEYSWRRKIRITHKDPFEELLKAINYVYKIE